MTAPALELTGIVKHYGSLTALDDASLVLRPGTVHALLGENGAGKTTLMRIAFGMVRPDVGRIRLDGRDLQLHSPADAIAAGIGMVHQHFTLVPAMTVAENVALGGHGLLHREDAVAAVRRIADATG
ncbi:MAG TPA: ATP-binding cassette domain-containing protein, partial [Gemmatimonadaceae bacterium]|nr:ATP-binding cassette domain-containing protein [Gemmatimonadaceae bacterium]